MKKVLTIIAILCIGFALSGSKFEAKSADKSDGIVTLDFKDTHPEREPIDIKGL